MKEGDIITVPTRTGNRTAVIKAIRGDYITVTWRYPRDNSPREKQAVLYHVNDVVKEESE